MVESITINIDSKYYRNQFDDWLAGGKVEYKGNTYYWFAQNNNYGYGWEVEAVNDDDWNDIKEEDYELIIELIENSLYAHKNIYTFYIPDKTP